MGTRYSKPMTFSTAKRPEFLVWAWVFLRKHDDVEPVALVQDRISLVALTPSQKALGKYLLLVGALFGFQVMMGG